MRLWPAKKKVITPAQLKSMMMLMPLGNGKVFANTGSGYSTLATEGYSVCWAAFACINKIATAVASVEPQLYRRGKGGKLTELDEHPLLTLLDKPNPAMSRNEFMTQLVTTFLIGGNGYVFGNGLDKTLSKPPSELQLLSPGKVKIEPGLTYFPLFYEYHPNPKQVVKFPVDQINGKSPILHLKTVNPVDPWYGLSPLVAAAYDIDIINSGQKWNKKLLDNDARPSGALVVKTKEGKPDELTEEQYARLKQMIDERFSGSENAGKPLLLEGGLEWNEFSMTPKELDFINGKYASARDVAVCLGVPTQLIGIPGDTTFANMEQAKVFFWTDTVIPWLVWFLEGFNRWLTPQYGDDLYLWYDEEMIPALEPLRKQKADRINSAMYMTINEKREAMGLDTLPKGSGGDTIFVPSTSIPLDLAGDPGLPEAGSPASTEDE